MYFRPLDLTASNSSWASSIEPKTAGTARGDVLAVPEHLDAVPGMAGASVATKTASIAVVLDQLLERGIGLVASAGLRQRRRSGRGTGR